MSGHGGDQGGPYAAGMSDLTPHEVVRTVLAPYDRGIAPSVNEVVGLALDLLGPAFPGGWVIRRALAELHEAGEVDSRWDTNPGTRVFWLARPKPRS